ncbi:MAG: (Fe-S)-binding protein [Chloroflexi bacterium]|uniref:Glycolate oxidase iron-sulfur subunit n=1 Tax=Candidatus Chlorohelix allophototropha TaxID=3003348 RepID=A0A8T7M6E0_9CHLR|nr:(Fe-S)-binding protein [Chloroflexota bacterium]WJW69552.1 (Fe-S)-binding protein [Chloroflexota bacterium L227-S17]
MADNIFDQKIIDNCVRCGLCLASCPTYVVKGVETSSPRGRISILNAVNKGNLHLMDAGVVSQIYECLDCRACEAVCPSGVQYGKLVESARDLIEKERAPRYSLQVRLIRAIALRGLFFRRWLFVAFAFLMLLYQRSGLQWLARKSGILKLLRLAAMEEMLPHIDFPFVRPGQKGWQAQGVEKHKVALFAGCIMSTAFSGIDSATGRVLAKNGTTVEVPKEQWCCGALQIHSGDTAGAQDLARRNIAAFEQSDTEYVIINAAGCGAALKEYDHLLHDDPEWRERAITFSRKVRDVSEYLAETGFTPPTANLDLEVTYQEPCHLAHAQRITSQPRRLLKAIPGLRLKEMEDSSLCCGSAGVYNLLNPTIANELVDRKLNNALATGAEVLCTANPGCHIQLEAGLKRQKKSMKVRHIVQLLDEAYRKEEN